MPDVKKKISFDFLDSSVTNNKPLTEKPSIGKALSKPSNFDFNFIGSISQPTVQDSTIPTDLPEGANYLSDEELKNFNEQIAKRNTELAQKKAELNRYEQQLPLDIANANVLEELDKAGVAAPIENIMKTGQRAIKNFEQGKTGEGIADVVTTLLHGAGTPFIVPFGVGEKISKEVIGKDATEMVGELLNLPFTATAKAREAIAGDLGPSYNEVIDLLGGLAITGRVLKGAKKGFKTAKTPRLGKPKGLSRAQIDEIVTAKPKVELPKPEVKAKPKVEPTTKPTEVKPSKPLLTKNELVGVKARTLGEIAEGITLDSPKLGKYKNEKLGTVKVINKLKEYGLYDETLKLAEDISKGSNFEIVQGTTLETVAGVMLKNVEGLAAKGKGIKPTKIKIIKAEKPKPVKEIITKTPVKELPKLLNKKIVQAADVLAVELKAAEIKRTSAFGSGRMKSTTINTYPDWFRALGRNRKDVSAALEKIKSKDVAEKGKLVEDLKETIIDRLTGKHEEAAITGTSGKFKREVMGKIEGDFEFIEFMDRIKKDLTPKELAAELKKFEKETSFQPGVDFYEPGKKNTVKAVKSLTEYKKFKDEFGKQKFTEGELTDQLFNLDKQRSKVRPSENPYLFRQTMDVAKELGKKLGKDISADARNIWVNGKRITSKQQFESLIKPIEKPTVKMTAEGAKRKAAAEGIEKATSTIRQGIKVETDLTPGKIVKASDIIKDMEASLGVPIKIGRIRGKALGIFKTKPEVVRLREANDLETASHEIAHFIDKKNNLRRTHLRKFSKELQDLDYDQGPHGRRNYEGFAEFVRHYLTLDDAATVAPNFHKWFTEEFLPKDPGLQKFIARQKASINRWREQGSLATAISVVDANFGFGPKAWMRDAIASVKKLGGFAAKAPEMFVDAWINKMNPINQIVNKIVKDNQIKLRPSEDTRKLASALTKASSAMSHSAMENGFFDFALNKKSKSLREIVKPVSSNKLTENGFLPIQEALAYAVAKHGETLWKRGINPGLDKVHIKTILEKHKKPEYETFSKELTEFSNAALDYLVDGGVFSKEVVAKMRELNPFYIPLKRVMNEVAGGLGRSKGIVDQGKPIKGFTKHGSGRDIINPLESIIKQTELFISSADKARVARSLMDLGEKYGGLGKFIEKLDPPTTVTTFNIERIAKQLEDFGADLTEADLAGMIDVFGVGKSYFGKDNIVSIYRNGKQQFYELDKSLFRAVKGLDTRHLGKAFDLILGKATRLQRLGATGVRPSFSLAMNPARDIVTYMIQNQFGGSNWMKQINPLKPILGMIEKKLNTKARIYFEAIGGDMAGLLGEDRMFTQNAVNHILANDKLTKAYNVVRHPIEALRDLMSFPEAGPRLAEAKSVMKKYEPLLEAAKESGNLIEYKKLREDMRIDMANASNEVTVNFKRSGYYGEIANQVIPFFNPTIQGTVNMLKSLKRDPIGVGMKALTTLTVPSLSLWYLHKDEKWYKAIPLWEKLAFLHFKIPDFVGTVNIAGMKLGAGDVMRLPLPFEWGYLFAGLPVAVTDAAYKDNPEILKEAIWETTTNSLPDFLPSIIKPGLETYVNYDFFRERPIISGTLEGLRPEMQFTDFTSETAKKIGGALGVSPKKVDHLITGYSGGMASDILKLADFSDAKEPSEVPIAGRFFTRKATMGINSTVVQKMYEARDRSNALKQTLNREKKAGRKYELNEKDLPYFKANKMLNKAAESLKLLRDRLQKIEDMDLDPGLKSQVVEAINQAAYIVADRSTNFLKSDREKELTKDFELPKIPKLPKQKPKL